MATALTRYGTAGQRRVWLERGLEVAAGLALAAALVSAITGSGVRIGTWTFPVRELWRPVALAAVLAAGRALMLRGAPASGADAHGQTPAIDAIYSTACWCGIAAAVFLWTSYQIRFCGGADSYGYVSAAHALLDGHLIQPQPIIQWLPFPDGIQAATPLGWAPAPSGNAIVPGYPLGLSVLMALFMVVAGPGAEFYVALVTGLAMLAVVYTLTARLTNDTRIAAAAAIIVAFNPVVTNMAIQPMSDVPAAFCYLLALYVLLVAPGFAAVAGLAAGVGIWIRPTLIVMLPVLLWLLPRTRQAWLRFAAGLAPVGAVMAGVQWYLYGGPLKTGYPTAPGLFRLSMVAQNAPTYVKWIWIIHSPLVFVAFALGVWRAPRRLVLASVAGVLLGIFPYLFKAPYFDDFGLIRYILPAMIPCLLVATIGASTLITRWLPRPAAAAALLLLASASAFNSYRVEAAEGTFQSVTREARYAAVGQWVLDHTPPESVVLAEVHSGSLRFYANRTTLRFALLPENALAATVRELGRRGITTFLAIDGEEEEVSFKERFAHDLGEVVRDPVGGTRSTVVYRLELRR